MFPTSGYSLYLRPSDVSAGATAPRLLDTPGCNLSHGPNVKTQWRFHWKWHLLLKCAGERWNINFINYVYSGLCTWSILIMWHIAHSTRECSRGSCATEGKVDSSLCLGRSLHVHLNSTTSSTGEACSRNLSCGVFSLVNYNPNKCTFCFIRQIDFTRPHADQGCCSDALPLFVSSLSERQVREGLHRGLPLQQQRHMQPHRWLLPVRSRLDRRGLLPGYALSPLSLVSSSLPFIWPLSFTLIGINRFSWPHTSQNR